MICSEVSIASTQPHPPLKNMSEPNLQNVTISLNSEVKATEERIASESEQLLANLILELHIAKILTLA